MVESPCIKLCTLDDTGTYCTGCFRTKLEIGTWTWMTDEEQAMTVALAETRKLANKLEQAHETSRSKIKARRTEPCNGHDSQG